MPPKPPYVVGDLVITVTDDLRVRSKPEVSDDSVKYEPTLRRGTPLTITAGPFAGSGFWWCGVEIGAGVTLNGGIDHGWVAAGAQDGTVWIARVRDAPVAHDPVVEATGWPTVEHEGVRLTGSAAITDTVDWRITVALEGLALVSAGDTETLEANGSYLIEWVCMVPDDSPIGGRIVDQVRLASSASDTVQVAIGRDGRGTGVLVLSPDRSHMAPCPSGWAALSGEWQGALYDWARHMALVPPPARWDTTF